MSPPTIQVSFFWKNNEPGGLGFTFGPLLFTPQEIEDMFFGEVAKQYQRDSDAALGSEVVKTYLAQLAGIGALVQKGESPTLQQAVLAAYNIQWLVARGFIPNDEFNGVQRITQLV